MIDANKIIQQNKSYQIVCLGDSTTSAEWVHPNWIDFLEFTLREGTKLGKGRIFKIINSACDGAYLKDIIDKVDEDTLSYKPDLVFVMIGLNDMISRNPVNEFESRLETLVELIAEDKKTEIALLTTTKPNRKEISNRLTSYVEVIRKIAERNKNILIDIFKLFENQNLNDLYSFINVDGNEVWEIKPGGIDYIHPNILGNRLIAEEILSKIFNLKIPDWGNFGNISTAHKS